MDIQLIKTLSPHLAMFRMSAVSTYCMKPYNCPGAYTQGAALRHNYSFTHDPLSVAHQVLAEPEF